jgi:hypothetical protein
MVRRRKARDEEAPDWSGRYEGDSRLVVGEIIVAYYNGTPLEASTFDVVKDRAIAAIRERAERPKAPPLTGLAVIADIMRTESHFRFPEGYTISRAVVELEERRTRFCEALRWLCSPKATEPAVPSDELAALVAKGIWGRYPEIDKSSEDAVAYFEDHGVKHFKRHLFLKRGRILSIWLPDHLIDLFCVFLLAECEGKNPTEMPFKFCRKCNKFFFSDLEGKARERKQFCSPTCQQVGHWTKSSHARSDSGFVERLLLNNPPDLRERLAKPGTRERLAKIKNDWQDWAALMNKVAEIETLTNGRKRK